MKIEINGQHLEVTEPIREYVEKKLNRSLRRSEDIISHIKVNLLCEGKNNNHIVETIVFLQGGKTLHNRTQSEDMYASIDIACSGCERQLRRFKEKKQDQVRYKKYENKLNPALIEEEFAVSGI